MTFSDIFSRTKIIAVVGLSDKPDRPSYDVARYLQAEGFRIIPINPNVQSVLGEKAYPDLMTIPQDIQIDVVDIFRQSDLVMPHVQEAIKRGNGSVIWMQEGIENAEAAAYAHAHGLEVVMNHCMKREYQQLQNAIR